MNKMYLQTRNDEWKLAQEKEAILHLYNQSEHNRMNTGKVEDSRCQHKNLQKREKDP